MNRYLAIETFIKVVELNSFTAAADALGLSRTMTSKHVADLEADLGVQLLTRTTRRVALTEAGSAYFERCKAALALIEEATALATDHAVEPSGRLRVNAPMSFGARHVAPAIAGFVAANPRVSIDLVLNDRVIDLVDEGFDLAIRIGRLKDSTLVARRLATCRLALCASPAYLERHGPPSTPDDLAGHACLGYTYSADRGTWRLERDGRTVEVRVAGPLQSNNGDALVAAACDGLGIVLQPTFIVGDALRDGRLRRVLPEWSVADLGIFAVFPPGRFASLKARSFADHLHARLRPEPYWDLQLV